MDTITIIQDTIPLTEILIPDTLMIKACQQNVDSSTFDSFKEIISFIAGITAVSIGFLLNRFSEHLNRKRVLSNDFENHLILFSKGQITYLDLLVTYNRLPKQKKRKIGIELLKDIDDIVDRQNECSKIINSINS